jgi:hypothetical protein
MSTRSIPARIDPAVVLNRHTSRKKSPPLADVAAVLLPGLRQAHSLLTVAIRVLEHMGESPRRRGDAAAEAAKARRLLAAFGHTPKQH